MRGWAEKKKKIWGSKNLGKSVGHGGPDRSSLTISGTQLQLACMKAVEVAGHVGDDGAQGLTLTMRYSRRTTMLKILEGKVKQKSNEFSGTATKKKTSRPHIEGPTTGMISSLETAISTGCRNIQTPRIP